MYQGCRNQRLTAVVSDGIQGKCADSNEMWLPHLHIRVDYLATMDTYHMSFVMSLEWGELLMTANFRSVMWGFGKLLFSVNIFRALESPK